MVAEEDSLPGRDEALGFYLRYDAKEVLGRGVSSVVRRCVCKESGQSYAVKIIDVSQNHVNADGLDMVEQVHQEINILRLVGGHPNVIELIEYFESPTYIFLVFELCVQGELFDYLSRNVRLSEKKCRMIMRQVFSAVIHCHQLGIVHRDLKPENILLDDDLNIKLTDFGFARKLNPGERLYETVGTPGYLAPEVLTAGMFEQDECNGYGYEVDAWACGVIMYTLLIGRPPFWHRKQMVLIRQIMRGEYTMIGADWAEVTSETKDLISKLLVVDDAKRVTVAGALNHEVFRAQRFSRSLGMPTLIPGGNENLLTQQRSLDVSNSFSDELDNCINLANDATSNLIGPNKSLPSHVPLVMLDGDDGKVVQLYSPPVFNARQTFKISIMCVRFLVRLLCIKKTPELLCLRKTQINPYCMRSYRKTIDTCAFTLYSHWVKKGEGQNRAAVFQNYTKQDKKKKMDKMDKTLLRP